MWDDVWMTDKQANWLLSWEKCVHKSSPLHSLFPGTLSVFGCFNGNSCCEKRFSIQQANVVIAGSVIASFVGHICILAAGENEKE